MTSAALDLAAIPDRDLAELTGIYERGAASNASLPHVAGVFAALGEAFRLEGQRRRGGGVSAGPTTVHLGDLENLTDVEMSALMSVFLHGRDETARRVPAVAAVDNEILSALAQTRDFQTVLRRRTELRQVGIDPDEPVEPATWIDDEEGQSCR